MDGKRMNNENSKDYYGRGILEFGEEFGFKFSEETEQLLSKRWVKLILDSVESDFDIEEIEDCTTVTFKIKNEKGETIGEIGNNS